MAIGEGARLQDRLVPAAEMRASLAELLEDGPAAREPDRGPARYLRGRPSESGNREARVGFITGTSDTYCAGCDRLRVASDGTLRPCLATEEGFPADTALRSADPGAVARTALEAWRRKPDGTTFKGCTEESAARVSIRAIGG
jgi:cyclic pyranopterin phosphate synthase